MHRITDGFWKTEFALWWSTLINFSLCSADRPEIYRSVKCTCTCARAGVCTGMFRNPSRRLRRVDHQRICLQQQPERHNEPFMSELSGITARLSPLTRRDGASRHLSKATENFRDSTFLVFLSFSPWFWAWAWPLRTCFQVQSGPRTICCCNVWEPESRYHQTALIEHIIQCAIKCHLWI